MILSIVFTPVSQSNKVASSSTLLGTKGCDENPDRTDRKRNSNYCRATLASFPVPRPAFRRLQYGKAEVMCFQSELVICVWPC